ILAIRCVVGGYPLDADSPDRLLIGLLDRVECEALIEFQALFALMAGDELNPRIRQAARSQIGDHLMTEQMRVDCLGNARPSAVVLYWSFHNLGDISLFKMKVMYYILWYGPGWEDITAQYIGRDALSCYRIAPSRKRGRGDREP